MTTDEGIDVLIVDDHPLIRLAITHLLQEAELPYRVQTSSSQQEATTLLRSTDFAVAIVDIYLSDSNGLELIRHQHAQHPSVKWLVLSVFSEPFHQSRARLVGADGFLGKRAIESELLTAINALLQGDDYPAGFRRAGSDTGAGKDELSTLSEREMTVFRLIAEGNSVEQMADALSRSKKTINALRDRIRAKLNVSSSAELTRFATYWYLSQAANPLDTPPNFLRQEKRNFGSTEQS